MNVTHLEQKRQKETETEKKEDAAMLKHPWNHINEPCGSEGSVAHQHMQNHWRKGGVLLSAMEMWTYSKKQPQKKPTTKWKNRHEWGPSSEASNSGSLCDALVSEENKRGWEKWASRCDSLFLRPPWHHLLTAGMCSIIFINIG